MKFKSIPILTLNVVFFQYTSTTDHYSNNINIFVDFTQFIPRYFVSVSKSELFFICGHILNHI